MDNQLKEEIEAYSLQNAAKYNGKANQGAVIGKIMATHPEVKQQMKEVGKEISAIIQHVNSLPLSQIEEKIKHINPKYLLDVKGGEPEKKELKELEDAVPGKVIMRFAPSPSGPMHIGHAITGGLTSAYCKKYNGKFILRIEDTNSDNIDTDAYEMLPQDAAWIFGNVNEVWVQSDRMQIYYNYIEKFIDLNAVYVCTCSQEQFKTYVDSMADCPCRNNHKDENTARWKKMFDKKKGFKEGEVVIRFKTNMQDKNPAMRDFPLARINDSKHPRQGTKYRVWPLMNLCVTVDDIEAEMTHIIRAKDHMDNAKRQEMMYKVLGKKFPHTYFSGRYNFEGLEISCSKTKQKIKEGEYDGWDDIRVPFLAALKRRGYQAEAFIRYTLSVGLTQVDKTVAAEEFFKSINHYNKEVIDEKANRYFFISNPKKITIKKSPELDVELDMHPGHSDRGKRKFKTKSSFYIEENDFNNIQEGELVRLMDCLNFRKKGKGFVFDSADYESFKDKGKKIVHWLPADKEQIAKASILMPDNTLVKGKAEKGIEALEEGAVVQFERTGFCRLDSKKKMNFWFAHK